ALTSNGIGDAAGVFQTIVAESKDDGRTWASIGTAIPEDFVSETIDSSESNPLRLYVTGTVGIPHQGFLERSDDRAQSWQRWPIDLHGGDAPYLAAIDPTDPDRLYVRIDASGTDPVLQSIDGGKTFTLIFTSTSAVLGFAISPDGSQIAVGSAKDGILIASRGPTPTFAKASSVGAACLTWTTAGLYACGREFPDGFTVGLSIDTGKSFGSLDHLSDLSPLACPADSGTGSVCPDEWPDAQATIGQPIDTGFVEASPSDARDDGTIADAGSSDGGDGGGGGKGCGCRVDGEGGSDDARVVGALGAIAMVALVRRKRPDPRAPRNGVSRS
ncbi:MAG: WD40/YVTN/BNR-like repeat-containing protein, partial [Polyangiales bacterium]